MANIPIINFQKALRYYMSAKDKKQQDLIHDLKLSSATVSQWVNGKAFPRMDRIEMLASYFGVDVTDLLTDPYEKSTSPANPQMIAKILESSEPLYELFSSSLNLHNEDIELLNQIAKRLKSSQTDK